MVVSVPGKGVEKRESSGGLEQGRVEQTKTGERGDGTTAAHFPNLSGSQLCGCIDVQGREGPKGAKNIFPFVTHDGTSKVMTAKGETSNRRNIHPIYVSMI